TVRLGPVSQKYNGTVGIEEADQEARRAVIRANGKDARGQGTASATITSTMHEEGGSTRVRVETDMHITGKVAQFGRGMQQEVATKIIDQFAACLGREIMGENVREEPEEAPSANGASGDTATATSSATQEQPARRRIIQQDTEPEPLDLGEASRDALTKRVVPVAVGLAGLGAIALLIWLLRR
ncbi:MAG: SRPBCC family protein, partial [Rubrobacter sp.]|nr:SRPBCC family protein [Rubrobacter sp.]